MLNGARERLTYANVMATFAVFLALGGGAWALTRNSVGPRQIKPNAVRSSDVRNQAIKGVDVNEATLGQVPSAEGAERADSADSAASATSADTAATAQSANLLDNLNSTDFLRSNAQAGGDVSGGLANLQIDPDTVGQSELAPVENWREVGAPGNPPFNTFCGGAACFGNFDSGANNTAAFLRDPFGFVHLKGVVKCLGGNIPPCFDSDDIFILPDGYHPAKQEVFGALRSSGTTQNILGRVNVFDYGGVRVAGGTAVNDWISLDGISFRCAPSGSNGCP
jgi:hypothetical protein